MSRRNPPQRTEQEIAEEEELQLALALSRSEAENKEKERERLRKNYGVYGGGNAGGQPPTHSEAPQPAMIPAIDTADMDPELARYLNRNYWQKRSEETTGKMATTAIPSAPNAASSPLSAPGKTVAESGPTNSEQPLQNGDQRELDKAQFLAALQSSLEIFVNRMRSNSQRGRPIANDSSVQSLFTVISNMHPQLLKYQQEMEDSRGYYEGLQDKLTQLRDAREALDSLREEHREKRRCEMEEQERLRQIQMMQKLEVMRQKKHEYLEMQRQLALQRLQEQEREMAMRLEQQKQLTHMRQMQAYGYPQMYGQQQLGGQQSMMSGGPGMMPPGVGGPGMVQGYGPGPQSTEGSPVHQLGGYGQNVAQQQQQGGLEGPGGAMQGPLPQSQGVYMGPGVAQSAYSQAQGGFTPQMSSMPGGYQPPPQGQGQLDGGQGQPGYNMPPSSMGYTDPNMPPVGQPSMQYTSMPPTMEYNSFNMQSMAQSLPQQQPPQGGGGGGMYPNQPAAQQPPPGQPPQQQQQQQQQPQQQQQYMGGQYPPSNVSNNQMSGQQPPHHPPPTHQQPHLPHQHPPSHQQHQQSLLDAQLISFD